MDSAPYRDLRAKECRALLRSEGIGRVGVSVKALPAIFPVRYAMLDEELVFPISRTGMLHESLSGAIVAFEADRIDQAHADSWSVLVVAKAQLITDLDDLEEAGRLPLAAWGSDHEACFARISCERISGRAYSSTRVPASGYSPSERSA